VPSRLCRSALLQSPIRLLSGSVSDFRAACAFAASPLGIASTDYPLSLQLEENLF